MFKKILICFISIAIAFIPLQATAQELEGKVTALSLDEKAPYSGVLLDPIAASKMIVDQKYLKSELELSLRKEFQQDLANKRLAYDLLKVEYDSLSKLHKDLIGVKEAQIQDLQVALKDELDDNSHWWMAGGVAAGIILSVAVFYASVEIVQE
jgi:hypothetical protein